MVIEPGDILSFWRLAGPDKWFTRSDALEFHGDNPSPEKILASSKETRI